MVNYTPPEGGRNYGANPGTWLDLSDAGFTEDLLPVVANPGATISPTSNVKKLGKVPTRYNAERLVSGFGSWTDANATKADTIKWANEPDYGCFIQSRRLRALDVDIVDPDLAAKVKAFLLEKLPGSPIRYRANSSKFLIPIRIDGDEPLSKRKFTARAYEEGGKPKQDAIEFLANKSGWIVDGTHPSGSRYEWTANVSEYLTMSAERFEALWSQLIAQFALDKDQATRAYQDRPSGENLDIEDPVAQHLIDTWDTYGTTGEGALIIRCPFEELHSSGAAGDTSTVYFPAGLRGKAEGHFFCSHTHKHSQQEYRIAVGYTDVAHDFICVTDEPLTEAERRDMQRRENVAIGTGVADQKSYKAGRLTMDYALKNFVFLSNGSRVVDRAMPLISFDINDLRNKYKGSKETIPMGEGYKTVAIVDKWLEHEDRQYAHGQTFAAGAPFFTNDTDDTPCVNIWQQAKRNPPEDWADRAKVFTEHIEYLFGDDAAMFLDWLAHIEQRPGVLPHTGWLHIAPNRYGLGRNWISCILSRVWRRYVSPSLDLDNLLSGSFNESIGGKVLAVVDEIRAGGNARWNHSQKLKQLQTADSRTINGKYCRPYLEKNSCRWLLFSNHLDALPLEDNDRRWNVVVCEKDRREPEYYSAIYPLKDDNLFIESVAMLLKTRDISKFNPGANSAWTGARAKAIEASQPEYHKAANLLVKHWPEDVITADVFNEILKEHNGGSPPPNTAVAHVMTDCGIAKPWPGRVKASDGKRKTLYALRKGSHYAANVKPWEAMQIAERVTYKGVPIATITDWSGFNTESKAYDYFCELIETADDLKRAA